MSEAGTWLLKVHPAPRQAWKNPFTVKETRIGLLQSGKWVLLRQSAILPTVSPGVSTQPLKMLPAAADVIQKLGIKTIASTVRAKTFFIFNILLLITKYYYPPYPTINKQEYYSFTFNRALLSSKLFIASR